MKRLFALGFVLVFSGLCLAQTPVKTCPPRTVVPGGFRGGFGFNHGFGFNPFFNQGLISQPIIVSQPPVVAFGGGYGAGFGAGYGFNAGFGAGCCGQAQAFVPQFAATGGCCGQAQIQQQVVAPPIVAATPQCGLNSGFGAGYGSGVGFAATPVLGGGCGVNPAFVGGFNGGFGYGSGFGFNRGFGRGLFGLGGGLPVVGNILEAVLGGGFGGFRGNALAGRRFAGFRR